MDMKRDKEKRKLYIRWQKREPKNRLKHFFWRLFEPQYP